MNVKIENLHKDYGGKPVYKNFNIEFEENKVNVLMGESGCGKTTLLNIIARLTPYEGKISGADDKKISYIFQNPRLIGGMTVYKNLEYVLLNIYRKEEREKIIKDILREVELSEKETGYPEELSGGQARRVTLARAFIYPSKIILADEPFTSLDIGLKYRLINLFKALLKKNPRTVVFVTHDADEAVLMADKIFILGNNEIKAELNMNSDKNERDVSSDECNKIRKEIYKNLI